jgi:hypothetical protein
MVDKVAKAIFEAKEWNAWTDSSEHVKGQFRDLAKVAIAAMREPTPEMLRARAFASRLHDVWPNMIDAALGEFKP